MTPTTAHRLSAVRQMATFGAIGVVSTLAYVAIFAVLRNWTSAGAANAVALLVTAVGNTAANRRLTFEVRGRGGLARDHIAGMLALGLALAITSGSLAALALLRPHHGRPTEIAVLVAANAAATLVRFLLLRLAIERGRAAAKARLSTVREPIAIPSFTLSSRERILR